jgi:hypothetical protein
VPTKEPITLPIAKQERASNKAYRQAHREEIRAYQKVYSTQISPKLAASYSDGLKAQFCEQDCELTRANLLERGSRWYYRSRFSPRLNHYVTNLGEIWVD